MYRIGRVSVYNEIHKSTTERYANVKSLSDESLLDAIVYFAQRRYFKKEINDRFIEAQEEINRRPTFTDKELIETLIYYAHRSRFNKECRSKYLEAYEKSKKIAKQTRVV